MSEQRMTSDKRTNPDDPTAQVTKGDLAALFNCVNAITTRIDSFEVNTQNLISGVTSRITSLEKDLADTSHEVGDPDPSATPTPPTSPFAAFLSTKDPSSASQNPLKRSILHDNDHNDDDSKKPKKKKLKKKKHHSSSSSDSSDHHSKVNEQMQEILDEYQSTKPKYLEDPVTSPIPDALANMLETWFWSVYSKDEVKAELSKPLRPSNASALIPTKINEAIFRSLSPQALSKDMPSRFIQNAFMKSSQPFALVWNTLIQLENHLKSVHSPLNFKFSDALDIDFQLLRKNMDQGLRLLGIANSQMVVHRKENLAQFLNKDFKKICKSHIAFDQWMFGSNLKTLLEDTARVNKLVQQNKPSPTTSKNSTQPFFRGRGGPPGPRGSFRGTRFHSARGRGFAKGWQVQTTSLSQQTSNKTGPPQNKSQTKRS